MEPFPRSERQSLDSLGFVFLVFDQYLWQKIQILIGKELEIDNNIKSDQMKAIMIARLAEKHKRKKYTLAVQTARPAS